MNQGLAIVIVIAVIAGIVLVRMAISRGVHAGVKALNRNVLFKDEYAEAKQMLSETIEYRTSLTPAAALEAVAAKFSASPGPGVFRRDVLLTERTPTCLRYSVTNRMAKFLETVVAAAPCGAGSSVTFDVVRWLESDGMPTARENLKWMRDDIEAALRASDPNLEVLIRANG